MPPGEQTIIIMAKMNETDNSAAVNLISQGTEITGDIKSAGYSY